MDFEPLLKRQNGRPQKEEVWLWHMDQTLARRSSHQNRKCSSSVHPRSHMEKQRCSPIPIWQCVKTLYPCSSHQNSWYMDVHPPKNGINR